MTKYLKAMRQIGGPVWALFKQLDELEETVNETTAKVDGLKLFISDVQTGTGSEQEITHNLGAAPTAVLIALTEVGDSGAAASLGSHTTTKIRATVTSGAKFQVFAVKLLS